MSVVEKFLNALGVDSNTQGVVSILSSPGSIEGNLITKYIFLENSPGFRAEPSETGRYNIVLMCEVPLQDASWRVRLDSAIRLLGDTGSILIKFIQNETVSLPALKSFVFRKWGIESEVIFEEYESNFIYTGFAIRKTKKFQSKTWTFGILTQGTKPDEVYAFCESVRRWGGVDHELLIVGPENPKLDKFRVRYVKDKTNQNFAAISTKKNAIVQAAENENLCLVHDRFWLNDDFFTGFDEFGYDFEFVTVSQFHSSGKPYPAFCAMEDRNALIWGKIHHVLDDRWTWTCNYLNGGFIIAKRELLLEFPFNNLIFHNQAEDVELARTLSNNSIVPRINYFSSATTNVPDNLTTAFVQSNVEPISTVVENFVSREAKLLDALPETVYKKLIRSAIDFSLARAEGKSFRKIAELIIKKAAKTLPLPTVHRKIKIKPHISQGINFFMYAGDSGGVLNLTIHLINDLEKSGQKFCIVDIQKGERKSELPINLAKYIVEQPIFPTNVWCIGFPFMSRHLKSFPEWSNGRWNICFTHWELPKVPVRLKTEVSGVNEFWTTSEFVREALINFVKLPVEIVDPKVNFDGWQLPEITRSDLGLPEKDYLFFVNWEFTSSTFRKNPEAALKAFEKAFSAVNYKGVGMVVQIKYDARHGAAIHSEYLDFKSRIKRDFPFLYLVEKSDFNYYESIALKKLVDCFVSLHRSEGYGMGCAEALALGKDCIMTGWSGNLEFSKKPEWKERVYLVDYQLASISPEQFPWVNSRDKIKQFWAEPSIEKAEILMRKVASNYRQNIEAKDY